MGNTTLGRTERPRAYSAPVPYSIWAWDTGADAFFEQEVAEDREEGKKKLKININPSSQRKRSDDVSGFLLYRATFLFPLCTRHALLTIPNNWVYRCKSILMMC